MELISPVLRDRWTCRLLTHLYVKRGSPSHRVEACLKTEVATDHAGLVGGTKRASGPGQLKPFLSSQVSPRGPGLLALKASLRPSHETR